MIFLAYIISGLLLAGIAAVILKWQFKGRDKAVSRSNLLNSLTLGHTVIYLVLTVLALMRLPLPVLAFHNYLFMDHLAIYEVLIAETIFLLAAIYGRGYIKNLVERSEIKAEFLELFYGSFNLLMAVMVFSFFSNNLALFWILLELTTILSAVLIVMLSARANIIAALKYVFIASTAMLFSVIGLIILFATAKQTSGSGTLNWTELMGMAGSLQGSLFLFAFVFCFIGFASKAGIVPFHTWLPQAHAKAPSMVSAVLSAVLLNGGIYGVIRLYAIAHRNESWHTISVIMIVFGTLSIAIAGFSMLPRSNLKKLIGFSSIEHMGLVLIGTGLGTPVALFWTLYHVLAHSLIKALLFLSAGILHNQYDSNRLEDMHAALKLQPLAAWGVILGGIAVIGLPPFPMFFSKLFILIQLGNFSLPLLILVLILLLIVAAALASLLIRTFTQPGANTLKPYDADWTMKLPILVLFVLIIGIVAYLSTGLSEVLNTITASLGF
jgi:hydrogenase-4 component F